MKKSLLLAGILAFTLTARAETLRVHVPVASSTANTILPAGTYSVTRTTASSSVFLFEGNGVKAFVYGRVASAYGTKPMTFELDKTKTTSLKAAAQAFALSPPKQ